MKDKQKKRMFYWGILIVYIVFAIYILTTTDGSDCYPDCDRDPIKWDY